MITCVYTYTLWHGCGLGYAELYCISLAPCLSHLSPPKPLQSVRIVADEYLSKGQIDQNEKR